MHNHNVTALLFGEPYRRLFVRLSSISAFDADPEDHLWNMGDEDHLADRQWLDQHAPGWSWRFEKAKTIETIELPIGANPVDDFVFIQMTLGFAASNHRDAWRSLKAAQQAEAEALRTRIEKRKAEAAEGEIICEYCAGLMQPYVERETDRLAQFAFLSTRHVMRCPDCESRMASMDSTAALTIAMAEAEGLTGLPAFDSPLWTDEIAAEYRRRRLAPPTVAVEVGEQMTAEEIVLALRKAIVASGATLPGRPALRVVAGGKA